MWTIDTPAIALNSSPAMWYGVPGPDEAYERLPGLGLRQLEQLAEVVHRQGSARHQHQVRGIDRRDRCEVAQQLERLGRISDSLTVCVFDISSSV